MFASPHVFDKPELRQSIVTPLQLLHNLGQNADNSAVPGNRAIGQRAHRPRAASAINDGETVLGKDLPEPMSLGVIFRVANATGSTVNANSCRHSGPRNST